MSYKEWLVKLQKDPVKVIKVLFEEDQQIDPYQFCQPVQMLAGCCLANDAIMEAVDQGLLEWFKTLKSKKFSEHELYALNERLFSALVVVEFLKPQQTLSLLRNDSLFWDQWLWDHKFGYVKDPRAVLMNIYMDN